MAFVIPEEIEFSVGEQEIEIIPSVEVAVMYLIHGTVGPLKKGVRATVPLWMAIHLRVLKKCNIVAPAWLSKDALDDVLDAEYKEFRFSKMACDNYMAVANMLFEHCPEDIPEIEKVRKRITDLWNHRTCKLKTTVVDFLKEGGTHFRIDNVTQMELCQIRPFFPNALDQLHRLSKTVNAAKAYSKGHASAEVLQGLRK